MRMFLCLVLFGTFVIGSLGKHHGSVLENELQTGLKGDFLIFGHHELDKNELCKVLRCKRNEVCLVKDGNAVCLKKRKLVGIPQAKLPEWLRTERNERVEMLESKAKNIERTEKIEKDKYNEEKQQHPNQFHKPYFSKQTKKAAQHTKHIHERIHHKETAEEPACTDKQLDAIGIRLKSWFESIHRQELQHVVHVAKHHVSCPKEVGWMFGRLDGDEDGLLTEDELASTENDPYERCLRPFMDRCDTDADDEIDMDEWCDCFLFSGNEREEPACHKLVHKTDPHLLGAFHPRCDVEGNFKPLQCHERSCWCVDKLGREFDGSRTNGERPDCGQYEEEDDEEDLEFNKIEKVDVHIR